jgi:hypothetical protein
MVGSPDHQITTQQHGTSSLGQDATRLPDHTVTRPDYQQLGPRRNLRPDHTVTRPDQSAARVMSQQAAPLEPTGRHISKLDKSTGQRVRTVELLAVGVDGTVSVLGGVLFEEHGDGQAHVQGCGSTPPLSSGSGLLGCCAEQHSHLWYVTHR